MACAAQVATTVLGVVNGRLPITSGEPELPADRVTVVAEVADPPPQVRQPNPDDSARAIGEAVASLIPAGAAVQLGPGRIATAVLEALKSPVRICSGVIDDMIVDLDERGLLAGQAETAYVVGSDRLYDWANGGRSRDGSSTRTTYAACRRCHSSLSIRRWRSTPTGR